MFSSSKDDEDLGFKKMHEFSGVDGFVEISESLADMIKLIANEPSSGLFHIQQHTQSAVPNLVNLNTSIEEKCHQVTLHTADSEDSIAMVRSMKECGFSIANEILKDMRNSVSVMSGKQPSFQIGRSISWNPATWAHTAGPEQDGERTSGYISNFLRSTKGKASRVKWPELKSLESKSTKNEQCTTCPNHVSSTP